MTYTRKQLRTITGLPDKTLRWLLDRLDIQPTDIDRTFFGSPIYLYDESALSQLHAYIFKRNEQKAEYAKGKRCRGGCNSYLPDSELNSQQICDHCRRRKWLLNEITHGNPLTSTIDLDIVNDIRTTIEELIQ
jgi:hypothetical protein